MGVVCCEVDDMGDVGGWRRGSGGGGAPRPFRFSLSLSRANILFATGAGCSEKAPNDALSEVELLAGGVAPAVFFLNNLLNMLRLGGLKIGTGAEPSVLCVYTPVGSTGAWEAGCTVLADVLRLACECECSDAADDVADAFPFDWRNVPPMRADMMLPRVLTLARTAPISSTLIRRLSLCASFSLSFSPHTSTGSRSARSISSMPRFWNLAIFASVPASTMTLVSTLCACRL